MMGSDPGLTPALALGGVILFWAMLLTQFLGSRSGTALVLGIEKNFLTRSGFNCSNVRGGGNCEERE
jgi:hypothetical protein